MRGKTAHRRGIAVDISITTGAIAKRKGMGIADAGIVLGHDRGHGHVRSHPAIERGAIGNDHRFLGKMMREGRNMTTLVAGKTTEIIGKKETCSKGRTRNA
jgi:hypothetical protein